MNGEEVASVCVAPLKGRDRAVEKAANMPIGPDKDRTEGPAIAWVRRFDLQVAALDLKVCIGVNLSTCSVIDFKNMLEFSFSRFRVDYGLL